MTVWAGNATFTPTSNITATTQILRVAGAALAPAANLGSVAVHLQLIAGIHIVDGTLVVTKEAVRLGAAVGFVPAALVTATTSLILRPGPPPTAWPASAALSAEADLDATAFVRSSWFGTCCTPNTATSRLGKKATWNVQGNDIPGVTVVDFGNYFQLSMPAPLVPDAFYLDYSYTGTDDLAYEGTAFLVPDDSWKRLITIAPLGVAPYRIAVGPQMQAVEAQPEQITVDGVASYEAYSGSNYYPYDAGGLFPSPGNFPVLYPLPPVLPPLTKGPIFPTFLTPSTADMRIYERYSVYDPDTLPTGGTQGTMYCGFGYFDFPPFTAEIDLSMPSKRCPLEFLVTDSFMEINQFLLPKDNSTIAYVAGAIECSRRMVDLCQMFPNPTPVFAAGAPFIAGFDHYIVGQPLLAV